MSKSRLIVVVLVLSFLLSGILEAVWLPSSDATGLAHGFVIAFLVFWWVGEHATEQGLGAPPAGARLLSALIAPFGLPYYFFRGYGIKSGILKLGVALFVFALAIVLYLAPFYIAHQFQT